MITQLLNFNFLILLDFIYVFHHATMLAPKMVSNAAPNVALNAASKEVIP